MLSVYWLFSDQSHDMTVEVILINYNIYDSVSHLNLEIHHIPDFNESWLSVDQHKAPFIYLSTFF